jgi:phosphorylcholine metabolism protein LicD
VSWLVSLIAVNRDSANKMAGLCGPYRKEIFGIADFKSVSIVDFDGCDLYVPCGSHDILTRLYGDYMVLPPESKRTSHHLAKYSRRVGANNL